MCEQSLCLSITNDNACETLILADLHSAEHLKMQGVDYINQHANEVMDSDGWKKYVSCNILSDAIRYKRL